jgi:hypothetical protein
MAEATPHPIQFGKTEITTIDPELVVEPMATADNRSGSQIPIETQTLQTLVPLLRLGNSSGLRLVQLG